MRYLLILCLALASTCASAEAYRWVDPQGRTVISDSAAAGPGQGCRQSRFGQRSHRWPAL